MTTTFKFDWVLDTHRIYGEVWKLNVGLLGHFMIYLDGDDDEQYFNASFYDRNNNEIDQWSVGSTDLQTTKDQVINFIKKELLCGIIVTIPDHSTLKPIN